MLWNVSSTSALPPSLDMLCCLVRSPIAVKFCVVFDWLTGVIRDGSPSRLLF